MNNFEHACLMSCEDWVNSFSDEYEFEFSKSFEKKMELLTDKMRNNKYHRMTRKTMRALIIAAIILSFATTTFAIPSTREYIIKQFKDHFSYSVTDIDEIGKTENLYIGYVPEGFEQTNQEISDIGILNEFDNKELWFAVLKNTIDNEVNYDNNQQEIVSINNIDYIIVHMKDSKSIIWNDGIYTYSLTGNIDEETLLKIAENIK